MVIYKMNNGGLWIHSCIAVNEVTLNAILALGNPEILLVPNGFHRIDCSKQIFSSLFFVSYPLFVQRFGKKNSPKLKSFRLLAQKPKLKK